MSVTTLPSSALAQRQPSWPVRLFDYKPFLIVMCLAPAIGLLAVFLTYPLGLGIWLAFTDTTIGRRGIFIGLENFQYLLSEPQRCDNLRLIWRVVIVYGIHAPSQRVATMSHPINKHGNQQECHVASLLLTHPAVPPLSPAPAARSAASPRR